MAIYKVLQPLGTHCYCTCTCNIEKLRESLYRKTVNVHIHNLSWPNSLHADVLLMIICSDPPTKEKAFPLIVHTQWPYQYSLRQSVKPDMLLLLPVQCKG